jgi:hypothetical protein
MTHSVDYNKIALGIEEMIKDAYNRLEIDLSNGADLHRLKDDLIATKISINYILEKQEEYLTPIKQLVHRYNTTIIQDKYLEQNNKLHSMCYNKIKQAMNDEAIK